MNLSLHLSTDNVSFTEIDLFPNQVLNYDAEFYDDKDITKVKLPFSTDIKIPLSSANKVFFGYDPLSDDVSSYPKSDYFYRIYIDNSDQTELYGILKVEEFEFNSDEPYITVSLKDFLSRFMSELKDLKIGDILTDSFHTTRHEISDFFDTTANGGEAGTVGTQPDINRIVNFPYIDLNNDVEKYGFSKRQFTEYGSGTKRPGIIPSLSVKEYLKQIGTYLSTSTIPVRVKSKLFGINETEAIPDFEAEKLQVVLPGNLQAKQDVNTRKFALSRAPRQSGRNESLSSETDIDGNDKVHSTNYFGSYASFGNFSSTPSTTYQKFGIKRALNQFFGSDTQGEAGYFCPNISFDGRIQWFNGNASNPSGNITLNIPTLKEDRFVYKLFPQNGNTDMKFAVYMDLYEDGYPKKRIRLEDSNGVPIVLAAQDATAVAGDSEKSTVVLTNALGPDHSIKYTALFGLLSQEKAAILDPTRQADYSDALQWSSEDLYLPENEFLETTFFGDSRYGFNLFVEPISGSIFAETITAFAPVNASGNIVSNVINLNHFRSDASANAIYGVNDLRKVVTEMAGTTLNIECKANKDFIPYFPSDEYIIKDSLNNTVEFGPQELLSKICKRFACGLFYEFDGSFHNLIIDPIHLLRTSTVSIDDSVDDLKSIKIFRPKDLYKNLSVSNEDFGLFFDDEDDNGKTIGSTIQELNTDGVDDLEIKLESSVFFKSLCGDVYFESGENVVQGIISEEQAGVVRNVPPIVSEMGTRFAYLNPPSNTTSILVPFCITYISRANLNTTTQRIYRTMFADGTLVEQPNHVFNGNLSHVSSAGFNLLAEDEVGTTTDYYDLISSAEFVKAKSSVGVEFSMVVLTHEVDNVSFMLNKSTLSYINNQKVLIKSVSGEVFEKYTYLDVKGIIE